MRSLKKKIKGLFQKKKKIMQYVYKITYFIIIKDNEMMKKKNYFKNITYIIMLILNYLLQILLVNYI